jgi:hypothetical protein
MKNLVEQLLTTPFKAKKGTDLHQDYGNKNIFVTEVDYRGEIAVGLKPNYTDSAWHDFKDLEFPEEKQPLECPKDEEKKCNYPNCGCR